jgi:primase-polymerase (primpol)-like protein
MSVSAEALAIDILNIPAELIGYNQWVCWRWEERDGKRTKVPYTVTDEAAFFKPSQSLLRRASSTDSATWLSFNHATAALIDDSLAGIGFVVTKEDPFLGADLDHSLDAATGTIAPWAQQWVQKLDSYTEITPSGEGLRIWLQATVPGSYKRRQDVELYDHARFFTVTGHHLAGTPTTIETR